MRTPTSMTASLGAILVATTLGATSPCALAAEGGALATIKADNARVQQITEEKPKPGTPAATKQEDDLKALAVQVLDLPSIARASLGKHWTEISPAQQKQFSDTFAELVKNNYVNQIRGSSGYTITYGQVASKDGDTTVDTTVKVTRNGHTDSSDVVYDLRQVGGKWMVEDIITDDDSMLEGYQSEFARIINEQGFPALQKKLEDRVAKLKAEQ